MAPGNDAVYSRRQRLTTSTGTLTSPPSIHVPLPTLPFDLIPEILSRLPVKLLLQLKCVCKSWKSLISDPKFAKKHLHMSTTCRRRHHLIVASWSASRELLLWDSRISSVFSNGSSISTVPQLQLTYPDTPLYKSWCCVVSSCDGILLFDFDLRSPLLWNPSIRKFKILPPFLYPGQKRKVTYTLGYDRFIDNYKIFAVSVDNKLNKSEVNVYTMGTDSWRGIDAFPYDSSCSGPGIFVSGTVNWMAFDPLASFSLVIVSLDLEKESYRKLLKPNFKTNRWTLGVLRDCLCLFAKSYKFLDVWVMKEYGVKESWTKLFSVPYVRGIPISFVNTNIVYVSEDDQVLLGCTASWDLKLVVYNSRNGTFKIPQIQNISGCVLPNVYVDSLISPCS